MSSEFVAMVAGVILSLLFSYIPKFKTWFDAKEPDTRRLIMLGLLALVPAAVFAANCVSYGEVIGVTVPCDAGGAAEMVKVFLAAMIANQATFQLTPGK